jgi:hypothetical protein
MVNCPGSSRIRCSADRGLFDIFSTADKTAAAGASRRGCLRRGRGLIWRAFDDVVPWGLETGQEIASRVFLAMWDVSSARARENR